jgi:hypothetical protein
MQSSPRPHRWSHTLAGFVASKPQLSGSLRNFALGSQEVPPWPVQFVLEAGHMATH